MLFFVNSIALGIGLAMDAFSVSIANGLREPGMNKKRMLFIAGIYAAFQFLMPMTGWFFVKTASDAFIQIQPLIPWVALALLLFIGGKMVIQGIKGEEAGETTDPNESVTKAVGFKELMGQGIATSIDALSVGFATSEYTAAAAAGSSAIIGAVTLIICLIGLRLGKTFGMKLERRGTIIGGVILIVIGIEIFARGVLL